MYCWNCGKKLKENYNACPKCGKKVDKNDDDLIEEKIEKNDTETIKTNKDSLIAFIVTFLGIMLYLFGLSIGLILVIVGFVIAIYALKIAKIEGTSSFLAKIVIAFFMLVICVAIIGLDYINYETVNVEKCARAESCVDNGDGTASCEYNGYKITCSTD